MKQEKLLGWGSKRDPESRRLRVGVIEDRPIIREGLFALGLRSTTVEIRWSVGSIEQALIASTYEDLDAILMSVDLGSHSFQSMTQRLRKSFSDVRLIGVVADVERWRARTGDRASLDGFVSVHGENEAPAWLMGLGVARDLQSRPHYDTTAQDREHALTNRELDVLRLLSLARGNRSIGMSLGIAEATVKRHVSSILTKLESRSRAEALIVARNRGYVSE